MLFYGLKVRVKQTFQKNIYTWLKYILRQRLCIYTSFTYQKSFLFIGSSCSQGLEWDERSLNSRY